MQLYADTEPLFPDLHGAGLGLLCVHDREEYRPGEGAPSEGDHEGHRGHKRCHLVHLVHWQFPDDGHQHGSPHCHHHGEEEYMNMIKEIHIKSSLV